MITPAIMLMLAVLAATGIDAKAADEAPANAWPMARGTPAGTGRSAEHLTFPLVESWRRSLGKTAFEATPVIADGTIYVGDLDGTFHALSLEDGSTRWVFQGSVGFPAAAAVSIDPAMPLVIAGDADGIVRAFHSGGGKVLWEYRTDGEISGGPTIMARGDGSRVLVGSQDASLTCLNLADGRVIWTHTLADQIRCAPTVTGDVVVVAGCDGKLHLIDAATGGETASVPIDGPTGTTPASEGGRVFFGTEGGTFLAIEIAPPREAWRVQSTAKGKSYRSSAAISGSVAIVGSRGRAIEAFATSDGGRRWRHPMRGRVDASPLVVAVKHGEGREAVIVGDSAGRIVAVDAATGAPVWEFDAGGDFVGGAAVADGRVVLANGDGTVWCFKQPSP